MRAEAVRILESFYVKCWHQIACVRWKDHISNGEVANQTGPPPPVMDMPVVKGGGGAVPLQTVVVTLSQFLQIMKKMALYIVHPDGAPLESWCGAPMC